MAQVSYLSVNRFLQGGFGIDTSTMTRAALRNTLVRATSAVNRYCGAPSIPQAFDFRGGAVVGEQHQWAYVQPLLINAGSRRVYLNQKPLVDVSSFVLQLAKNYTVTLDPIKNIVVNRMEGYCEVVALTPVISGYFPVGWNFGLWNPLAVVDYTYGWTFEVTGDECEAESTTLYTASHGNWSDDAPTVYVDGMEVDPGDYTINTDDGSINFSDTATPTVQQVVTADYTYTLPDAIAQATGIVATGFIAESRMASRGMIGLQSLRVAEVAITAMQPSQMTSKNGVSIPMSAASLLGAFTIGSAA
jgi:hypothetical protein